MGTSLPVARSERVVSSPSRRGIITSMITASGRIDDNLRERVDAVGGRGHFVPRVVQGPGEGIADGLVVVDNEDVHGISLP